jgi:hypothetical protein
MKKFISIGTAIATALLFVAPLPSIAGHWYVGGNLYNATAGEWHKSSYENKLATAANWTLMDPNIRKISNKSSSMETVRPYAIELVACVDQVSVGDSYAKKNVSSLAAACIVSMGW